MNPSDEQKGTAGPLAGRVPSVDGGDHTAAMGESPEMPAGASAGFEPVAPPKPSVSPTARSQSSAPTQVTDVGKVSRRPGGGGKLPPPSPPSNGGGGGGDDEDGMLRMSF